MYCIIEGEHIIDSWFVKFNKSHEKTSVWVDALTNGFDWLSIYF